MSIISNVKDYLELKGVPYEVISQPPVFSCIEEAKALGIEADEIAKNLVIKIKDKHAFVVLPGAHRLNMNRLKEILGKKARLELEEEMLDDFPGYELGAIPPLGEIFGYPVYVDRKLLDHETVIFTGGTHTDSIKMKTSDFVNLVEAEFVDVAEE